MNLAMIGKTIERFARDNSPVILTVVAVAGTATTAVLAHRAALEADKIIQKEWEIVDLSEIQSRDRKIDRKEQLKLVWKCYIPPVTSGVLTIGAILGVNRVGTRRAAALAAAYGIMENTFDEYREKVTEKLGEKKELALRDELAQERISRDPVSNKEVLVCLGGDVLCYDVYTGRYFTSSVEAIKKAQNEINYQIIHHNYASLSDFYASLGIPPTIVSEAVGWNTDHLLDIQFSTCMSEDDRPCIHMAFRVQPDPAYQRFR